MPLFSLLFVANMAFAIYPKNALFFIRRFRLLY